MIFNAEQAACICGCTVRQVRYWSRTGIIQPFRASGDERGGEGYDFRNLVELRTVARMLARGISLQKIRKTLAYLRESTDYSRPLSECKLVTDGSTIFEICDGPERLLDTLRRGQVAFCIALDDISEEVSTRVVELTRERQDFLQRLQA
ncbi:MAG: MerR family transcriptional regulator [Actinobacteria bacterium]|nr:MerR family transcriptional regulator [Actinomycetota bacterium]